MHRLDQKSPAIAARNAHNSLFLCEIEHRRKLLTSFRERVDLHGETSKTVMPMLLAAVASYWRHVLGVQLQSEVQHRLRKRLFHHLQRLSMAFFQRHHAGALGARVSSDITAAGALFDKGIVHYAMDIALFLGVAVWLVLVSWQLTIVACVPLAITGLIMWRVTPALRRQQKAVQEGQSRITGIAAEIFAGITLVKASAGEHEAVEEFSERSSLVRNLQRQTARMHARFNSVTHAMVVMN